MLKACIVPARDGLYLRVHVQPGARRCGPRGLHGDALKIAVREAAQEGRANAALEAMLASALGVARCEVQVVSGHRARGKRVFIRGDAKEIAERLLVWVDAD